MLGLKKTQIASLLRYFRRQSTSETDLECSLDQLMPARNEGELPRDLMEIINNIAFRPLELEALKAEDHIREFFDNENFSDVGRRCGYSAQAVINALKRARLKIATTLLKRVKFNAVERQAFEGRLFGQSFVEIAENTGLAVETLQRAHAQLVQRIYEQFGEVRGLAQ